MVDTISLGRRLTERQITMVELKLFIFYRNCSVPADLAWQSALAGIDFRDWDFPKRHSLTTVRLAETVQAAYRLLN